MRKKFFIFLLAASITVLFNSGCSTAGVTGYDITGNWSFTFSRTSGGNDTINFNFMGTVISGTASDLTRGYSGTYTANNTAVNILLTFSLGPTCGDQTEMINGSFTSSTTMSGTYDYSISGPCLVKDPWITWQATKL